MTNDLLNRIVSTTRAGVACRRHSRPLRAVEREAAKREPRAGAFHAAVSGRGVNVIAECKRRSPVNGVLREHYEPDRLARCYEAGGAVAISVLTEPTFFDGALDHLSRVRAAVSLPVLRKDFIVDEYQIVEARAAGADAVLLIVAVVGDLLAAMMRAAERTGLAALVEVHDAAELRQAVDAGARLLGVNNRNLRTMAVRPETCAELAPAIPADRTAIAESGIRTSEDVARLRALGYSAFLIGEPLVRSTDPAALLRGLVFAGPAPSTKHQAPHEARSPKH